ncbi:hypothetical protein [Chitinimonas sp. PSY-7]|uniref:hypothetical protein n=1 Tax=Chitinimonas sp. PSY-7 TaxID=3459088 RepID=UPI00403FE989
MSLFAVAIVFLYIFTIRLSISSVPIVIIPLLVWFTLNPRLLASICSGWKAYLSLLLFLLTWIVSTIVNQELDSSGVSFFISRLLYLVLAFPLIDLMFRFGNIRDENGLFSVVNKVFVIQIFVIALFFFYPSSLEFISQYLYTDPLSQSVQEATIGFRLIGIGVANFGGGILFGLYLLSLTAYITADVKRINLMFVSWWLLVALSGFLIARSSIVAVALSFLYFSVKGSEIFSKFILRLFVIILTAALVIAFAVDIHELINSDIIKWGFEFLFAYFEEGEATTASTDHLLTMYILPNDYLTYFWGDGRFFDPIGAEYYMNTDVGYIRLIFYVGIFGMIAFIQYIWSITVGMRHKASFLYAASFYFFVFLLILNFKGFVDATQYLGMFFAYSYMNRSGDILCRK